MVARNSKFSAVRRLAGMVGKRQLYFKSNKMENDKYLIMCANCAHPSGQMKWFLLQDEDENTAEFDRYEDAKEWCDENESDLLAYTILATSDFTYR